MGGQGLVGWGAGFAPLFLGDSSRSSTLAVHQFGVKRVTDFLADKLVHPAFAERVVKAKRGYLSCVWGIAVKKGFELFSG
jgi:hypothetical protein